MSELHPDVDAVLRGERAWAVVCGDALELLPTLPEGSVDMIWTDPPYGHGNQQDDLQAARVRDNVKGARKREVEPIANDTEEDFRRTLEGFFSAAGKILRPDCCCCCCCCGGGGPKPTFAWVAGRMDEALSFFHAVVWDKSRRGHGLGWRYRRNYEFVMVAHRRGGRLLWNESHPPLPNVLYEMPVQERLHPNEKPVRLVERFVLAHTEFGQLVLDPFAGSGTTGDVALRNGRRFIGFELSEEYCDLARRRLAHAERDQRESLFPARGASRQLTFEDLEQ